MVRQLILVVACMITSTASAQTIQWKHLSVPLKGIVCLHASGQASTIYAGSQDSGGLYRTTDNGSHWNLLGLTTDFGTAVYSVFNLGSTIYAGTDNGIYLSADNGVSWKTYTLNNGLPNLGAVSAAAFAASGSTIFTAANWWLTGFVCRSNDNGNSWEQVLRVGGYQIWSVVTKGKYVFASAGDSVYRSTDSGDAWTPHWHGNYGNIYSMVFMNNILYIGTDYGVYSSKDYGDTWIEINSGLSENGGLAFQVNSLVVSGKALCAGTNSHGIFITIDNGKSWHRINKGLTASNSLGDTAVTVLCTTGTSLFVATAKKGVYVADNSGFQNLGIEISEYNKNDLALYPNPTPGKIKLILRDMEPSITRIDLTNESGVLVRSLLDYNISENAELNLDLRDISVGTYFIRLITPEGIASEKFTIVR